MRRIVIRTLRQAGFDNLEIIEAGDGAELVEMVRTHNPDLVLSDWNMPNLTGLQALAAIRAGGYQVPFGFITAEGSDMMRAQAAQAGASFLVAKPFNAETIQEALFAFM
jgi:two-component system chemotaxis response regulator CheY